MQELISFQMQMLNEIINFNPNAYVHGLINLILKCIC
jgi:hypothetical protein